MVRERRVRSLGESEMDPDLAVHDLSDDQVLVDLHELVTATGPAWDCTSCSTPRRAGRRRVGRTSRDVAAGSRRGQRVARGAGAISLPDLNPEVTRLGRPLRRPTARLRIPCMR